MSVLQFTAQEATSQAGSDVQLPVQTILIEQPLSAQQQGQPLTAPSSDTLASGHPVSDVPQVSYQTEQESMPQQSTTSSFLSASTSEVSHPFAFKEVMYKLNNLRDDQMKEIQNITDEHWKSPEFPLARVKKIMRMDEDVRMISAEVPVMFSKALEMFITELSLSAWLQTEEAKRRTVQRSDIALAITKHDMFDFLIDIVPREEIQIRTKTTKQTDGEGENLQLLPPDILQLYIQHIAQQAFANGGGEEGEVSAEGEASGDSASGLLHLQLLQQLIQLQQIQQEQIDQQQQQSTDSLDQLQHPANQSQPSQLQQQVQSTPTTLNTQVLQTVAENQIAQTDQQMVHNALEQLARSQLGQSTPESYTTGGQQTLHHVDPPLEFHQQHLGSHSATVVIEPPLLDSQGTQQLQQQQQTTPVSSHSLLDSHGQYHLQHLEPTTQQCMQPQNLLENIVQVLVQPQVQGAGIVSTGEHFVSDAQSVGSVALSNQFTAGGQDSIVGEHHSTVDFQNIPESESISRSISPITARLSTASDAYTN